MQYPDGGYIDQGCGRPRDRFVQAVRHGAEEVERANGLVPQPHRDSVDGRESHLLCGRSELRPLRSGISGSEVRNDDGQTGAVTVQARALVVLDLEQFCEPGLLSGGSNELKCPPPIGEQQPRGVDLKELHAPLGEHVQELHQVIVADKGVGQLDEGLGEAPVHSGCHDASLTP